MMKGLHFLQRSSFVEACFFVFLSNIRLVVQKSSSRSRMKLLKFIWSRQYSSLFCNSEYMYTVMMNYLDAFKPEHTDWKDTGILIPSSRQIPAEGTTSVCATERFPSLCVTFFKIFWKKFWSLDLWLLQIQRPQMSQILQVKVGNQPIVTLAHYIFYLIFNFSFSFSYHYHPYS